MATPHVSPSRTVNVYKMFTADGKAVYPVGPLSASYTLDGTGGRRQVNALERIGKWEGTRIARAEAALGAPCKWEQTGTTEVMDVAF